MDFLKYLDHHPIEHGIPSRPRHCALNSRSRPSSLLFMYRRARRTRLKCEQSGPCAPSVRFVPYAHTLHSWVPAHIYIYSKKMCIYEKKCSSLGSLKLLQAAQSRLGCLAEYPLVSHQAVGFGPLMWRSCTVHSVEIQPYHPF